MSAETGLGWTPPITLTVLGIAYFSFLFTMLVVNATLDGAGINQSAIAALHDVPVIAFAFGIACGVGLALYLTSGRVELGLVPLGALGVGIFSLCLFGSDSVFQWDPLRVPGRSSSPLALFFAGASSGIFLMPLLTRLQFERRGKPIRGIVVVCSLLSVFSVGLAIGLSLLALENLKLSTQQVYLLVSILTFGVTTYSCWLLPEFFLHFLFWTLTHTIYRIRVLGRENLPSSGPGLLICNHVSYADGNFIMASTHRLIRFMVWGGIANSPYLRWLGRIMGAIPISATDGPRALAGALRRARDALRNGDLVCIFAEGQISRTGNLLRFKRGFEKVVQGVDAPIIPTFLDCVWGSIFSHQGGRFFWKWPRQLPYPVTVSFGAPLPPNTDAFRLRQAIQELGVRSVEDRKSRQKPLHRAFVRNAARHPFRFCMADTRGTELTYGKALASTIALSRVLQRRFGEEKMVGVLLPPSVAGSLINLAMLAAGKIPINLNYTASSETIASCVKQCEIKTIFTSPEVLKRIRIELPVEPTAVEELRKEVRVSDRFLAALGAYVLPGWVTEHWLMGLGRSTSDDLITVIFSSGSTGEPKGVMLSHHNVVSNCEAVIQVIDPTPADRIVGILPLFHAFGFIANLGVPFIVGCGVAYHNNPLESKEVGDLTAKYGGTILLATPTFLRSYTRKIPAEQFKTLRWVLAGAEKLPREVADSFHEKFGVQALEGYGCTELSPVAAVNIPDFVCADGTQIGNKPGTVGHPIPGVAAKVVDPDTGEDLPSGRDGLLLIKGPNVMMGYFKRPDLTAESIRDGWYVTGDIAHLDEDGFITITDRLSRFSKIAGEMVPHIRVEESIRQILGTEDQGAVVAGVPDPSRGERLVVIHPPLPIPIDELWHKLNASNLPKLWIPSRGSFYEVPELPYLGTGKLDLRRIKEMAHEFATCTQTVSPS